jgi:hypothetical protein
MSSGTVLRLRNDVLRNVLQALQMRTLPSALRYRDLKLTFEVEQGSVLSREPLLTLGGVRYFTSDQVEAGGELRLHLVPPGGKPMSVRAFVDWLRSLQ